MINFIEKKDLSEAYIQLAKTCKKKNLNLAVLFYVRKVLALSPHNTEALILQSRALYDEKHYSQALTSVKTSLEIIEKTAKEEDQEIIAEFLSYELRCRIYTKNFDDPEKQIQSILGRLRKMKGLKPETQDAINQLETDALEYLKTKGQRSDLELKEEAMTVHEMLRKDFIGESAGQTVYILAVDWFENWKKEVKYNKYFLESENEESKNSTNQVPNHYKTNENFGYISQSSILDDSITIFDLKSKEQYSNQPVKRGLLENQDFMIISAELWEYFSSKYGGTPIPRFTFFKSPKDMRPSVEVWLQKINFILYPLPQQNQPRDIKAFDVTYISINKTVANLTEKLHGLCKQFFPLENSKGEFYEHRLWKIDPHEDFRTLVPTFSIGRANVIPGTILTGDTLIMDAEISEDDVLVLEYKIYQDWLFQKKEKADRKLKQNLGLDSKTLDELQIAIKEFDMSVDKDFHEKSRRGICGLQNLGNTCFMNSALQCLSNTMPLTNYFLYNEFLRDLNFKNPLGAGGKLAIFYSEWMKEMWMDDSKFVSPWAIKKLIGKFAPQFYGYGQQDSGELLSYLLDGLHEDLNKVKSKPNVEQIDTTNLTDEEAARESWINHLKRNQSKIQELMHGQYKSRLDCPDCKRISITFDPFATVPLPLPIDEYSRFEAHCIPCDTKKPLVKINFSIPNEVPHSEIKSRVAKILQEDPNYLLTVLQKDQKIVEFVKEKVDAAYFKQQGYTPFMYRTSLPCTEFFSKTKGLRLFRVNVYAEAKYFFESDKLVSHARLIEFNSQNTLLQLHLEVFKKMREHVWNLHQKMKNSPIIDLKQTSDAQIEKEFKSIFDLANEKYWPYKLYFCEEELLSSKKLTKSKLLPLTAQTSLEKFANSERVALDNFVIEIKINCNFKWELFDLNVAKEYLSSDPQEGYNREYTIYDCLSLFTRREKLDKENAWYCNKCQDHKEAFKTMELYSLPEILIFHFKRFKTSRIRSIGPFYWASGNYKNTSLIEFPLTGLDMKKYTLSTNGKPVIYDLYAVSNHYGSLNGGHYTAYCKNAVTQKWYEFDDTRVSQISEKDVVTNAAYLLFYQRRKSE